MVDVIEKALRKAGLDRKQQLAKLLGITPQALSQWQQVPPLRVLDFERVTGIPRHEIRPDLYPPPARSSKRSAA